MKLYLSHEGVRSDEIWSHKFYGTRTFCHQRFHPKESEHPHSSCFPLSFRSSLHSQENFSEKSIFRRWEVFYFLITLFQRIFNQTLLAVYCIVVCVCVCVCVLRRRLKRDSWQWCGQWVKAKRIKRDPIITHRRSVVSSERTKWPLSPCLPYRDIIRFAGENFLEPKLHFILSPPCPAQFSPPLQQTVHEGSTGNSISCCHTLMVTAA